MKRFYQNIITTEQLKFAAIISMILNHIYFLFIFPGAPNIFPSSRLSIMNFFSSTGNTIFLYLMLHPITFLVMGYLLVLGYERTKNVKLYMLRMFVFAVISQIPFTMFKWYNLYNELTFNPFRNFVENYSDDGILLMFFRFFSPFHVNASLNVGFTLLFVLCLLYANNKIKNNALKVVSIFFIVFISYAADWGGIRLLGFYLIYKTPEKKRNTLGVLLLYLSYAVHDFFQLFISTGSFFPPSFDGIFDYFQLMLRRLFSGQNLFVLLMIPLFSMLSNNDSKPRLKYFFYVFYPVHLVILVIIRHTLE